MARTKSFKFRINTAERRMIARLAEMASRSESDLIRRLIVEAAAAKSISNPEDEGDNKDRLSHFKQASE